MPCSLFLQVLASIMIIFYRIGRYLGTVAAINFGRQGHSLTQSKMLHCKTVVNIITYRHIV
jgi:hypothetical protein